MPEPGRMPYPELIQPIKDPEKCFLVNIQDILQDFITKFLKGVYTPNFNSAAMLLQGCSSIYGKKVEYIHNLALQLHACLTKQKRGDQNKKDPKEKEKVTKEKHNKYDDPFSSVEIRPGKNLSCLRKKKSLQQTSKKTQKKSDKKYNFVPVDLLPLEGEAKGDVFLDTRGDVVGNKGDYTLNKCRITTSGWLLLPTVSPGMIPTEFSSPDYTLEPEPSVYCNEDADMIDSSPLDEGYAASDGCTSTPSSQATSTQPISSQHTDEGFGSVPTSPHKIGSEPLNNAVQSEEPMEGIIEEGAADPVIPTAEDIENVPMVGQSGDVDLTPRRKSLRSALKVCQLSQQEKDRQNPPEENLLEPQSKNAVIPKDDEIIAVRKAIQKKNTCCLPSRLRNGKDHYVQTTSEFCAETFFSMNQKLQKNAINRLGVPAFALNTKLTSIILTHYEVMKIANNRKKCNNALGFSDDDDDDMDGPEAEIMKGDDSYGCLMGPLIDDADIVIENDPVILAPEECFGNVSAGEIAPVPSTSEEAASLDKDILYQSFEVNAHEVISAALKGTGVDRHAEIARKVYKWEQTIKPFLEELDQREKFDINVYGSRILDSFEDSNRKQSICFRDFCKGKEQWEIHRYFMALLPLINIGNVSIETEPHPEVDEDIYVTLLSRKMHHKELEEFGHDE